MSFSPTKSLLRIAATIAWLGSFASAQELKFSDLGNRLAAHQPKNEVRSDVQLVSYLHDPNAIFHPPPPTYLADPAGIRSTITDQPFYYNDVAGNGESDDADRDYYAEVQFMFLRAHVIESAMGKLSEQYQLSPRFVIGYESPCKLGGRIRFWHFDHLTPNMTVPADVFGLEFDVYDIEGTTSFGTDRTELIIAGGFRWTDARITVGDEAVANDMPGITFAADVRGIICDRCKWELVSIAGARWSLLGGDWHGSANGYFESNRDDNLTVTEIYGGFEYMHHTRRSDVFARIAMEVQSWHSDVASQTGGGDSINFMGPGLHIGVIR